MRQKLQEPAVGDAAPDEPAVQRVVVDVDERWASRVNFAAVTQGAAEVGTFVQSVFGDRLRVLDVASTRVLGRQGKRTWRAELVLPLPPPDESAAEDEDEESEEESDESDEEE